jgi:cation:H+ antiporter
MIWLMLIIGFVFLIKGADLLVEGSASIARRFGISDLVIGLTVVAFGTSAPELVVNLFASFKGNSDIAVGNILGSNVANILLVIGIAAVICPLAVKKRNALIELPISFAILILLLLLSTNFGLLAFDAALLSRFDGFILILAFIGFLWYSFRGEGSANLTDELPEELLTVKKATIYSIIGLTGLTLGGQFIVDGAVDIAKSLGMSEALIGLTIVAVGTSLPEIATSAMAAMRKNPDLAMGNAVGSNIFNVLWVLGCSATILPLPFGIGSLQDSLLTILATVFVFALLFLPQKFRLGRKRGMALILAYAVYIVWLVQRG